MKTLICFVLLSLFACTFGLGTISFNSGPVLLHFRDTTAITFTLSPAPTSPLSFTVTTSNPLIVKASETRFIFVSGQTTATIYLTSPPNGLVGGAFISVSADRRSLYNPASITVNVVGTITLSTSSSCFSVGNTGSVTALIDPPTIGPASLIVSPNGLTAVSSVNVPNGQSTVTFDVTPTQVGSVSVTLSTPNYQAGSISFSSIGAISTNQASSVYVNAYNPVEITLNPPPSTANVQVTIATTNAQSNVPSIIFAPGQDVNTVYITGSSVGTGSVTYASTGYCTYSNSFSILPGPVCPAGSQLVIDGESCVVCPGGVTNTCNFRGICTFSNCNSTAVRCQCTAPFKGINCEFGPTSVVTTVSLGSISQTVQLSGVLNLVSPPTFTIPANLVGQTAVGYLAPYNPANPFQGQVDASTVLPGSNFVNTNIGFEFLTTCADNTAISKTFSPVSVSFELNPRSINTEDFVRLTLYKWEPFSAKWIVSGSDCSPIANITIRQINTYTISANLCSPGQYNLFYSEVPVNTGITNSDKARPVQGTTGEGGFQPPPPIQPSFTKDKFNPSAPVIYQNSAASVTFSVALFLISLFAAFAF